MQRLNYLLPCLTLCFLFLACGGNESGTDAPPRTAATQAASTPGGGDCFGPAGTSICAFLPMDIIRRYVPRAEPEGYRDTERQSMTHCGVSHEDPEKTRPLEVAGMKMDVPVTYTVSLNSIQSFADAEAARRSFAGNYRTRTAEEKAQQIAADKAQLQKRVEAGKMTQEQADMAGGFAGLGASAEYAPLPGVGDQAAYGGVRTKHTPEIAETIYVLAGSSTFTLEVDLGQDSAHSRAAAAEIARGVVAKCGG